MKIKSLELSNFKQFYGNQIVDISTSSDKNVTVFRGVNGTGKTSLFTAINWCLYGIGHEGMGEIVNKQIVADAKDNDEVEANVKVRFSDKSYDFVGERSLVFQKLDGRLINEKQNFYLFQIDKQGQTTKIPNPEGKMDSILPKNVREYFFFNGEKMDDLTRPGNTKIEDAIKNIMHLPIIDKAVVHLSSITKDYRSEISKIATDRLEKLIKEQDNLEKEIEKLRKDNENIDNEIIKDETQIKDLEKILADSKEVGQLQLRRKQLQDDLLFWRTREIRQKIKSKRL
jgi:DNA sulfur modification protein DndD